MTTYQQANRQLQDEFHGRRFADCLEETLTRTEFTVGDEEFIESLPYFLPR